jgi:hypothetical protein
MKTQKSQKWVEWVKVGCTHFFIEFIVNLSEFMSGCEIPGRDTPRAYNTAWDATRNATWNAA